MLAVVQVGLGGAIPQQTVVPIEMAAPVQTTTPLTNGVYTIVSYPRSLTPGCRYLNPTAGSARWPKVSTSCRLQSALLAADIA